MFHLLQRFFLKFLNWATDILKPWFSTFKPQSFTLKIFNTVYGISFPWTYVDRGISPEDLSPELKDPYL